MRRGAAGGHGEDGEEDGSGAGEHGGDIVAAGTPAEVAANPDSLTGRYLAGSEMIAVPETRRDWDDALVVKGARQHNLTGVDVEFPIGVLTCVTGVSGSGKSTLVNETLYPAVANRLHKAKLRPGPHDGIDGMEKVDKIINIDQSPIGRTPRSNPATYTGVLEPIRKAFAKANGVKPALFSANSEGACPTCNGAGVIYTDLAMMAGVATTCEECEGKRFSAAVLEYTLGGKNISEVLEMPVARASSSMVRSSAPTVSARLAAAARISMRRASLG